MQYIIFQIVFFCILLYYVFRYNKSGVSRLILIEWTVSSVCSYVYTFFFLLGQTHFDFWPVLYFDLCYFIFLFPVLGLKIEQIEVSEKFVNYSVKILTVIGILSILPLVENLIYLVKNYSEQSSSIIEMYQDKMDVDNTQNLITWLSPLGLFLHNLIAKFTYPGLIILFVIATKRVYITPIRLFIICCLFANTVCYTLNSSGRGGVAEFVLIALVFFILFRKSIVLQVSRRLKILILLTAFGIVACMVILTMFRAESVGREGEEIFFTCGYLGEGSVNFFEDMWYCRASAQGDYSFSYIKNLFGFDTFINFLERREYWNYGRVGYDPLRFYTFIGSWFADLRFYTIILVLLLSILFKRMLNRANGTFNILSLYAIYIYLDILIMGFSVFPFMNFYSFRQVVINFLYIYFLYYITKEKYI